MSPILLLATGCAPQDAEITGTYHTWLSVNSSATVDEDELKLHNKAEKGAIPYIDCRYAFDDEDRDPNSTCDWKFDAEGNETEVTNPVDESLTRPYHHNWIEDDGFYVVQDDIDAWRSEAIITSEGDFQLTFHHDLGNGQDYRVALVIDPVFEPTTCIQSGSTCYTLDGGDLVDDDGDGWADFDDPDCLEGAWETGFDHRYECNDGVDNDSDGSIDAADSDCPHAFATEDASCSNGTDDDGDSWADDNDFDCVYGGSEDGSTNSLFACSDGEDNDGDGNADIDDDGCESATDIDEGGRTDDDRCRDDYDDDGDGWTDKDDPDCDSYDAEAGWSIFACNDGIDNDDDGDVDADDADCVNGLQLYETATDETCTDTEDNDEDGWTDEEDPDCVFGGVEDNAFFGALPCNDGLDNDAADTGGESDGIDAEDSDCQTAFSGGNEGSIASGTCSDFETDDDGDGWSDDLDPDCLKFTKEKGFGTLPCNDSVDNDEDGLTDADDPGCISPMRYAEVDLAVDSDCADGEDNDLDGLVDSLDGGCLIGDYEADFASECNDGIDNDSDEDGVADADDADCITPLDISEEGDDLCADEIDNDGDGWTDTLDSDCGTYGYEVGYGTAGCANGLDDDGDGDVDTADADCIVLDTPYEQNQVFGITECNDGEDNDGDGEIDADDPDCNSENTLSMDNIEAYEDPGEPIAIPMDRYETVENWSTDEEGQTIYYLNAGAYQRNPSDSGDNWFFPNEWYSGYAHSKFAAEEFESAWIVDTDAVSDVTSTSYSDATAIRTSSLANQAWYLRANARDPDPDYYADWVTWFEETADVWAAELPTYAGLDYAGYDYKVEGNQWRPLDDQESGLDGWVEIHRSWVRIDDGSELEAGGSASGDFQIYLTGYEAISQMVVQGSFKVDEIQAEKWHNGVLEDELRERNNTPVCE